MRKANDALFVKPDPVPVTESLLDEVFVYPCGYSKTESSSEKPESGDFISELQDVLNSFDKNLFSLILHPCGPSGPDLRSVEDMIWNVLAEKIDPIIEEAHELCEMLGREEERMRGMHQTAAVFGLQEAHLNFVKQISEAEKLRKQLSDVRYCLFSLERLADPERFGYSDMTPAGLAESLPWLRGFAADVSSARAKLSEDAQKGA